VLNADCPIARGLRALAGGRVLEFSMLGPVEQGAYLDGDDLVWVPEARKQQLVCPASALRLRGRHNIANMLAACAISGAAGANAEAMRQVAGTFAGVEHRLELVREVGGVGYYNDSIATSPERAMAAMRAFSEPLVLLAGGRDKHLPWDAWAEAVRQRVRELVCFGELAPLLEQVLAQTGGGPPLHVCRDLEEAVSVASKVARPGDVVLLSPGGTSFDAYRDFEARGEAFRALVREL